MLPASVGWSSFCSFSARKTTEVSKRASAKLAQATLPPLDCCRYAGHGKVDLPELLGPVLACSIALVPLCQRLNCCAFRSWCELIFSSSSCSSRTSSFSLAVARPKGCRAWLSKHGRVVLAALWALESGSHGTSCRLPVPKLTQLRRPRTGCSSVHFNSTSGVAGRSSSGCCHSARADTI
jgi:hypothetical protein